jgi:hypothetical protein
MKTSRIIFFSSVRFYVTTYSSILLAIVYFTMVLELTNQSLSDEPLYSEQGSIESCDTYYVFKKGIRTIVSNGTTWIYDDLDSANAIQKAITSRQG